ncbi:MAG: hypothetical protein GY729_12295 [Desulfobacteraceae bacterium]|nr:hypothetical protein [Desulfobacteraceae bacterium]
MGGKRIIQRYKNIIYPACCLITALLFAGCQHDYYPQFTVETVEEQAAKAALKKAEDYASKGEFKAALDENKIAYETFPPQFKQEAIFQKGLLYLHPDNPKKNYERAMACFELIEMEKSHTMIAHNSGLTLSVLKESCSFAKKANANKRTNKINKRKIAVDKNKINALISEQSKLKKYIKKLRQQIKQLKEVDLSSGKGIQGVLNE